MEFGFTLPNLGGTAQPDALLQMAQRIEGLGYDSLWVSDHVVIPNEVNSRYPYNSTGVIGIRSDEDILEPFTAMSYLAGATRKLRLGISVMVLPYRHPVLNSKMMATLDVMSGGRTIVGAGVGWMKEEFDLLDADYDNRGRVTDEHIKIFKALCTQEDPVFEGEHYRVHGTKFSPKPLQKPHPPIWVGGTTNRAILRAATLGDGWHVVRMRPEEVAKGRDRLLRIRREQGLDTEGYQVSIRTTLDITDASPGDRRTPLTGTPQQVADDVKEYQEAGVEHIVLGARGRTYEEIADAAERFAGEVMPKL